MVGTLWAVSSSREKRLPEEKKDKIQHIKSLQSRNEAAHILATLIERDGAGDVRDSFVTSFSSFPL